MIIKNKKERKTYQEAARISSKILRKLKDSLRPGIYPIEIERLAEEECKRFGVKPAFKGVGGAKPYEFVTCISVNETVVHGVPSKTEKLNKGDLVKVDFGIVYQGYFTDQCVTVCLGEPSQADRKLLETGRKAVQAAVKLAVVGKTTGDLGVTMQTIATQAGFDVLKQYTGHGIGKSLHEQPNIPAHGKAGGGVKLKKGMVICVEAQVVAGSDKVYVDKDGWTVKMKDGKRTVMFEYMVIVGRNKPVILTETLDWPLVV